MNTKISKYKRRIKKEYLNGATSTELATKYNVTHQAILYNLKQVGVSSRPARRRSLYDKPIETKNIIKLYLNGNSMPDIAKQYKVSERTIALLLRHNKIKKHPKNMRSQTITMPTDLGSLGYIAGMFDGEGNLQFREKHNGRSIGCKISIYSTTIGVADWFQKTTNGGKILWDTGRVKRSGWKPISSWCLYRAQDVASFLVAIYPFLIIKKDAAKKAIKLFSEHFDIKFQSPQ